MPQEEQEEFEQEIVTDPITPEQWEEALDLVFYTGEDDPMDTKRQLGCMSLIQHQRGMTHMVDATMSKSGRFFCTALQKEKYQAIAQQYPHIAADIHQSFSEVRDYSRDGGFGGHYVSVARHLKHFLEPHIPEASLIKQIRSNKVYGTEIITRDDYFYQLIEEEINRDCGYIFNANFHDIYGTPFLHICSMFNMPECVSLLLQAGANPNKPCCETQGTALHRAYDTKNMETVKVLVDAHADVNAQDRFGDTPLHRALSGKIADFGEETGNQFEIVEYLLDNGADPSIESKTYGDTPRSILQRERVKSFALAYADDLIQDNYPPRVQRLQIS